MPADAVVVPIEAPCPLARACAKDERTGRRVPVERQVVGGRAGVVSRALVLNELHIVDGCLTQVHQPWRPVAVINIHIPLVAEEALHQSRARSRREVAHRRVSPEAVCAVPEKGLETSRENGRGGMLVHERDSATYRLGTMSGSLRHALTA